MSESNDPEKVKVQIAQMRDWLNDQPHLPKDVDDLFLHRFLHSCYYDLDKAKTALDLFFTIRGNVPEILDSRDPLSPEIQKFLKILRYGYIPISGNRMLWLWQLNDPGLENYDYITDVKTFFLGVDVYLLSQSELKDGDVALLDIKDISLKFLTKLNLSVGKKLTKYQGEAIPMRLKQIHIMNAPSYFDKIFSVLKPFFSKQITESIHLHQAKSNTILKYLDKDDLPEDYGGNRISMTELTKESTARMLKLREALMKEGLWRATVTKKSKNKKTETAGDVTAFRSLSID